MREPMEGMRAVSSWAWPVLLAIARAGPGASVPQDASAPLSVLAGAFGGEFAGERSPAEPAEPAVIAPLDPLLAPAPDGAEPALLPEPPALWPSK